MSNGHLEYGVVSEAGKKRKANHDGVYTQVIQTGGTLDTPKMGLFIISDGIGLEGNLVSQEVVRVISTYLNDFIHTRLLDKNTNVSEKEIKDKIIESIQLANAQIVESDSLDGASVSVVLAIGQSLYVGHVGVTAVVLFDNASIQRLNTIHLFSEKLIELGHLTREDIGKSPIRNPQYRVIGSIAPIDVDTYHLTLDCRSAFMMLTSGFLEVDPDEYLSDFHIIVLTSQNPQHACDKLLDFIDQKPSAYADKSMILVSNGFPSNG